MIGLAVSVILNLKPKHRLTWGKEFQYLLQKTKFPEKKKLEEADFNCSTISCNCFGTFAAKKLIEKGKTPLLVRKHKPLLILYVSSTSKNLLGQSV